MLERNRKQEKKLFRKPDMAKKEKNKKTVNEMNLQV